VRRGLGETFEGLTAFIHEVTHGPEADGDELIVEGIQLAQRRNAEQGATEEGDFALKGTLARNDFVEQAGGFGIGDFHLVEPDLNRLAELLDRFGTFQRSGSFNGGGSGGGLQRERLDTIGRLKCSRSRHLEIGGHGFTYLNV
jgi:hypothetical protein